MISFESAIAYHQHALVVDTTPLLICYVVNNSNVTKRQSAGVVDPTTIDRAAVPDGHLGKADMRGSGNCDHPARPCPINYCVAATEHLQIESNREVFCVGRGCDHKRVTRSRERDAVADRFAGCCRRQAAVVVGAGNAVYIPRGAAGRDRGRGEKESETRSR